MDIGKFLRLQGAIQGVMDSVGDGQAAVAGQSMAKRYEQLVAEARRVIPESDREDFDRVLPRNVEGRPASAGGANMFGNAALFNEAKGLLGTLAGYLGGYVAAARMEQEAQAYAKERVKQEKGVGFRPPPADATP